MSVVSMKRIHICAMRSERKAILQQLQHMGTMQVECSKIQDEHFSRQETASSIQQFKKTVERLEQANTVLAKFAPEKSSLLSSLAGKKPLTRAEFDHVVDHRTEILADVTKLLDLKKHYDADIAEIGDLKGRIEALGPWMDLDIPPGYTGSEHVRAFIGSFGFQTDESRLAEMLETPAVDLTVVSSEKNYTAVVVLCHKNDEEETERALRANGFTELQSQMRTTPAQAVESMQARIGELEAETEDLSGKIAAFAGARQNIRVLSDYFRVRSQKYETIGVLPQTENVFLLSGYIPADQAQRVADYLEGRFIADVEIEDLAEDEDAPVLLRNNRLADSVEGVLSSYGLPAKGDIDPTAIMYWFYVAFFGLMLSDAAYGLIMTVACAAVLIAFPRMAKDCASP